MVLFQTTVKDAEELAPEFAEEPEEAWEEEIEKESVEVLEEEWTEKVDDEVIDGEEPVQTYKRDLVTHLLHNDHPDLRVMKFVTEYLRLFRERIIAFRFNPHLPLTEKQVNDIVEPAYAALRDWLFEGMTQTYMLWLNISQKIMLPFSYAGSFVLYPEWSSEDNYRSMREWKWYVSIERMDECQRQFNILNRILRDEALKNPSMDEGNYRTCFNRHASAWIAAFKSMFCDKGFSSQPCDEIEAQRVRFDEFCMTLRLCQLGLNQQPVYTTDSGLYQQRKRKQIHYIPHPRQTITHPRKTIMHPQRTEADMVGEMRRELINLPRFTAWCKTVEEVGGRQIVSKYKLSPKKLEAEDDEIVVQNRKQDIRTHTIQSGYVTERNKVKQEIADRRAELLKREPPKPRTTLDEDEE